MKFPQIKQKAALFAAAFCLRGRSANCPEHLPSESLVWAHFLKIGPSFRRIADILDHFQPKKPAALATVLTGDWDAVNTQADPDHVKPVQQEWRHGLDGTPGHPATYVFPPRSYTTLKFQ